MILSIIIITMNDDGDNAFDYNDEDHYEIQ